MNEWMHEWMNLNSGGMDLPLDFKTVWGIYSILVGEWIDRLINKWMNECMNEWI